MLRQYYSELGAKQKNEVTARYNAFISKWAVRTKQTLKGRGVKLFEDGTQTADGRNFYYCTQRAFDKLCSEMDIDQELLFN